MSNAERLATILKKLGDAHYQAADELLQVATEQPAVGAVPTPDSDDLPEFPPLDIEEAPKSRDDVYAECPDHQRAWVPRPGGVSKNGRAYPAFWSCPSPKDAAGNYCKKKPDPSWARAHDPEQALLRGAA